MKYRSIFCVFCVFLLTAGCGGGSGGGGTNVTVPVPTPPVAVQSLSVAPGDGEVAVSWALSTGATGYNVYWSTQAAAGTSANVVSSASSPVTLSGLNNGTPYFVTVSATNADGSSALSTEATATPQQSVATTGWSPQTLINTPYDFFGRDNYLGAAAINDSGVAVVGWILDGSGGDEDNRAIVNHTASGDWGTEEILTTGGSSDVAVAVTPSGDIFVAWSQYSLDVNNFRTGATIESQFYRNGIWSATETLATVVGGSGVYASNIVLRADGQNNIIATWTEDSRTVWVNRYDTAAGWQGATLISTSIRLVQEPALGTNAADEAVLVWFQDTIANDPGQTAGGPSQPVVYASHYNGSSWSAATAIGHADQQGFEYGERLHIDVNSLGSAVAVWQQNRNVTDGTAYRIDALYYDATGGGWSAPETIVARDWQTSWPDVAIDGAGRAIASWQPTVLADGSSRVLDTSMFDTGTASWSAIESANVDDGVTEPDPLLVEMREGGDVFAVWQVPAGDMNFRRYDSSTGSWDSIAILGPWTGASTRLAMSRNGYSIVATNPLRTASTAFEYVVYATIYTP